MPDDTLRYGAIEAALAEALEIAPDSIGAFRARLRHLRSLGVPSAPKTGSGSVATYSRGHALEMLLALQLENIGIAPRAVAMAAPSIVRTSYRPTASAEHVFIVFDRSASARYMVHCGERNFSRWLKKSAPRAFAVVNLTACAKALETALQAQTASATGGEGRDTRLLTEEVVK